MLHTCSHVAIDINRIVSSALAIRIDPKHSRLERRVGCTGFQTSFRIWCPLPDHNFTLIGFFCRSDLVRFSGFARTCVAVSQKNFLFLYFQLQHFYLLLQFSNLWLDYTLKVFKFSPKIFLFYNSSTDTIKWSNELSFRLSPRNF